MDFPILCRKCFIAGCSSCFLHGKSLFFCHFDVDGSEILKTVPGAAGDRSVLYGAQTPQIFHSEVLKKAYMQAFDTAFTDDASVVEKDGKNLSYIMGERFNIKITTQDDLILAKAIMSVSGKD